MADFVEVSFARSTEVPGTRKSDPVVSRPMLAI
jgi:hypothetical protein